MDQNITFTNFNKVESVTEGEKRYALTYGVNEQRIKSEYSTDRGSVVRYYIGSYEEVTGTNGVTTKLCYLPGGAVMMERNGVRTLYYNYTDRLGSIVSTTDAWGNVVERYAYDPWGERLNPENWTEKDTRTDLLNNRGFTGHEHIDGMSLINMNGRVYDPLLGSFLSVDPFIQAPDNWLNYNRYLYCFGNPLSYVDPSGNIGILACVGICAAVGAVLGTGAGLWYGYNHGYTGWDLAKSALIGAGIGTCLGALSGYFIGSSVSALMAAKTLWTFTQLGSTIGGTVGTVGGTIYGLAKKADGLELANYSALGSLIGMAAGAAIGAGCYGIYSYCTLGTTVESETTIMNLTEAKDIAVQQQKESYKVLYENLADKAHKIESISPDEYEAICNVRYQTITNAQKATKDLMIAKSSAVLPTVSKWANVGYAALTGVGTAGAGFGYHYLSKFLFDQSSYLYGD